MPTTASRTWWRRSRRVAKPGTADPVTKPGTADPVEIRRPAYLADLAAGVERFFEPERTHCPWCGSDRLRVRLRTTDLLQRKPGRLRLDRCQACGHIFQNPRLTADGLEFYYRDCYDGLGEQVATRIFASLRAHHRRAAAVLRPFTEPGTWLDVGTGQGHFCHTAREIWPRTRFDGLDMSEGVERGRLRGWLERAYRGGFVDLAPDLTGCYDVVSMLHYLEHTPDPQRELAAARTVLRPGGYLLIDLPDPESRWAVLLGRQWVGWLQPQHLHLFPVANLRHRLTELGFTVLLEQFAEADRSGDLAAASWFLLNSVTPAGNQPWLPRPPGRLRRLVRGAVLLAGVPWLVGAALADRLIDLIGSGPRRRLSNAYRILARAPHEPGPGDGPGPAPDTSSPTTRSDY